MAAHAWETVLESSQEVSFQRCSSCGAESIDTDEGRVLMGAGMNWSHFDLYGMPETCPETCEETSALLVHRS